MNGLNKKNYMTLLEFAGVIGNPKCAECPLNRFYENGYAALREGREGDAVVLLEKASESLLSQNMECCGVWGSLGYILGIGKTLAPIYKKELMRDLSSSHTPEKASLAMSISGLSSTDEINDVLALSGKYMEVADYRKKMDWLNIMHLKVKGMMLTNLVKAGIFD
ncbi:MAG: hypothetical protein NTU57_02485 [Candidatus Aenigmarchaeota archaeon]|nr:hypothetical protein [Candidatus Aenigmarchaeota archaeon]